MKHTLVFVFFFLILYRVYPQGKIRLVDRHATKETKALAFNLNKLSKKYILFGHQHATEYGHGWSGDQDRSDVKSVTGSHPAVIGVDFSGLSGRPDEAIEKEKEQLRKIITQTYNRGGVVTVSWHFNNPVSPGGFYWVDSVSKPAVKYIIPGGSFHEGYKAILKRIASLALSCKGDDGKPVPMIFRPFHELDGYWFWWGKNYCTVDEFRSLWRFTVSYLRDSLKVRNFIYAYSPDCTFNSEAEYAERYPGNEWVDMLGLDDYADFGRYGRYNLDSAFARLKIMSHFARKNHKLAALTETGLESIPDTVWWTGKLLQTTRREKLGLCYVLVWRNDRQSATHYYAPYPGQVSVPDFLKFYNDPFTLFERDLKKIYKR